MFAGMNMTQRSYFMLIHCFIYGFGQDDVDDRYKCHKGNQYGVVCTVHRIAMCI